ncbi:MAG: SLBB domain-containing protein [Candidatus Marinimicrobia bacterium]|nr:SLBB domain-containing protein [Candidatus Neomarinimicrobiota bacterium]
MKKTIILLMVIAMGTITFAQDQTTNLSARFSGDMELIIPVKVWGEVVSPGIYDVPIGYDLLGILSVAGGPINSAKLTNVKVIRGYRLNKDEPIVVYVDLANYIETGDESLIPEIRGGDTIMVPPKFGKNFVTNFAALLAIAQSITIIAYYIDRVAAE